MKDLVAKIDEAQRLYKLSDEMEDIDEAKADELYAEAYKLNEEVAQQIVKITSGKIDQKTAGQMVWQYPDKIKAILNRAA